jgi:hypothetical protein
LEERSRFLSSLASQLKSARSIGALVALPIVAAATLLGVFPARAQAYVVNTLADTTTPGCDSGAGFTGSLRQCIGAANAAGGTNTIYFSVAVTGQLTLTQGHLTVDNETLNLYGPDARKLAIDGNANDYIFLVNSNATLNLSSVTVQNGHSAGSFGAVDAEGGLSIAYSTVKNNVATGSVGAIFSRTGPLSITYSTIVGNHADQNVPAMEFDGTGNTLANVTIAGNTAAGADAAVWASGTTSITNSTIVGNTSSSGGGGVFHGTLKNTILAGNLPQNCEGAPTADNGNNLDSANSCGFATGSPKFDKINTDPMLATTLPANNGGFSDTLRLTSNSPAIDAGTNVGCPADDQRQYFRIIPPDPTCDIGAYEFGPPVITGVSPNTGTLTCGTPVTLAGYRFNLWTGVTFGSAPATILDVRASNQVATVACPAGTGTVDVRFSNIDGTSAVSPADRFTYTAPAPALPKAGGMPAPSPLPPAAIAWAVVAALALPAAGVAFSSEREDRRRP